MLRTNCARRSSRIRLGIELLQQNADPKYKAALERDIAELDALIDEILLASRLDASQRSQHRSRSTCWRSRRRKARATTTAASRASRSPCSGDPRLLRRLIRNLLENAQRHGEPPMRVTVRRDGAQRHHRRDGCRHRRSGGRTRARVRAVLSAAGGSEGTGLGLSLVRQIARLHGGDAAVAPRPGHPSCFQVSLPNLAAPAA